MDIQVEKMHPFRTHTCGQLRADNVDCEVRISGWVHRVRDHGGIIFVDLRDDYGVTQVVIHPEKEFYQQAEHWRLESVVCFTGQVVKRSDDTVNPRLATGEIEVVAADMIRLNDCKQIPFQVAIEDDCHEDLRLRYRFLDLRRSTLHDRVKKRSQIVNGFRRILTDLGFTEFHTPILTASSPEGARDFLVPSRLHPGTFYALPQAPQLFKQLLMCSGFDRYFQIAPCFRDEDARADRSPGEFYQVDIEMAFATQDDVFAALETLFDGVFGEFAELPYSKPPFRRISFAESMLKYGSDKPDLRIPIEISDVSDLFAGSDFNAFRTVVEKGGVVRAIPVHGAGDQPRSFFDGMIEFAQSHGGKGLAYITWTEDGVKSPIAKFLSQEVLDSLTELGEMKAGDVMFFVADKEKLAGRLAGEVRVRLADLLDLRGDNRFEFCWIVDYPMFELNEEKGRIDFSHNPFSMPQGGMEALENDDPLSVLGYQYDLVCNGVELSSGAIRNHRPDIMMKAFEIAGYTEDEIRQQFGGMLRAFEYGAPPHGGIAPGLERVVMLLTGCQNIREVTAFPMNQGAQDPLLGAPAPVNERQLRELHIRLSVPDKKKGK
jgi:aspartyl-tRNA synthetase